MSVATGDVEPMASSRSRRSAKPVGLGRERSNSRTASISLWDMCRSPACLDFPYGAVRPKPTARANGATIPRWLSCWCGSARLGNVLAPLDPSHQPFELLRRLGAEIGVVHSAQLLGDGK